MAISKIWYRKSRARFNTKRLKALDGNILRLKYKTYSEKQILKISAELDKSFSKYFFSKEKNTRQLENELSTCCNKNSQNKTLIPKIKFR